ncbi:MAG: c-type cytochrome [Candidatus Hydrogenedentes bacterium]|nr:c-type cytochrome [Candidatus Hydrogenedentota bacterium]
MNCTRISSGVRGLALGLAAGAAAVLAPAPAEEISFGAQVRPILEATCYECHGAERQKGELRLDSAEAILKGGEMEGASVVAGKPEESPLYKRTVLEADHPDIMPAKGDPLTSEQTEILKAWILAGATFDDAAPAPAAEAGVFESTIWPIFQERCVSCHGAESQKGDLRLDSPEAILKGGEHYGPAIVAGKPDESPIRKLITLPADDPDIMPAKGDTLTPEQIQAISDWIAGGADFGGWSGGTVVAKETEPNILEELAKDTAPAEAALLEAVAALGGLAMPLDMKTPLVRVDYHLVGDKITDEQLATLPPLAAQLTWLNLAGTKITDSGLAPVAGLSKLTRLHLERTGITDAGLTHIAGLKHLEYLNLYGTQVTDAGLEHLKGLPRLKKLFLWQTGVTKDGAAGLQAALPQLAIDLGIDPDAIPATEMTKIIPAEMFTPDSCCAKVAAENKVCEHPCCDEARQAGTVCTKCNAGAEALLAIVAKFDADGCCAKAYAGGKLCDHDCCKEAWANKTVCAKCNPKGAAASEAEGEPVKLSFDEGSCCATAQAAGNACDHPCCVEALAANQVCTKCNPNAA